MNYLKTDPQGIDRVIQEAQVILYDNLVSMWGIDLDGFGRVYKNEKKEKVVPEVFDGDDEYSGTLFSNERSKFFFSKSGDSERNGIGFEFKSPASLYFMLDLSKIKPAISHRADQEVQRDVLDCLEITGIIVTNIVDNDLNQVFREFSGMYEKGKFYDMHPYHVFRLDCELVYDLK